MFRIFRVWGTCIKMLDIQGPARIEIEGSLVRVGSAFRV